MCLNGSKANIVKHLCEIEKQGAVLLDRRLQSTNYGIPSPTLKMKITLISFIENCSEPELSEIYDLLSSYQEDARTFHINQLKEPQTQQQNPIHLRKRIHARKMNPIKPFKIEDVDRLVKNIDEVNPDNKNDD